MPLRDTALRSLVLLLAAAPALRAQEAAVQGDLMAAPGGGRLAVVGRGAEVEKGAAKDGWREVTVTGWVPISGLRRIGTGAYPLAVQGEQRLRAAPDGPEVGLLGAGMVAAEVARRPGWIRIRRTGWIRDPTARAAPPTAAATPAVPAPPPAARTAAATAPARPAAVPPKPAPAPVRLASAPSRTAPAAVPRPPAQPRATAPVAQPRTAAPSPAAGQPRTATPALPARPAPTAAPQATAAMRAGSRPAAAPTGRTAAPASTNPPARRTPVTVQTSPNGRMVAVVEADAPVQVLARDGEWTRVRLEGWTRAPIAGASAGDVAGVTLKAMQADPDAFKGREVDWTLRFVSLQVADALRTDFTPGESFILARDPNGETGFVYVALTPEQVPLARRMTPFSAIRVAARVRTGRSPLVGHPILELIRLR
ncbi:MAG TPA: hypothetical protein VFH27_02945 [Longimicrobiaceae bacterium]|nr:hypothetical protein [Longimicrobiaceae bacterium]